MSRIGRMPITIPAGVEVKIGDDKTITVKGPKGTLSETLNFADISFKLDSGVLTVERANEIKQTKALHGLCRALINNMVVGVTEGFSKELEINGVGYRAQKQGNKLILSLGYSHPVEMEDPQGITVDVPNPNKIVVSGADKQVVGEVAAKIREKRPPEPYKGKGIKYVEEHIRRKEGKAGKAKS